LVARELPQPDPNESLQEPALRAPLPSPTALFPLGQPSRQVDRLADRILEARPGLLIVLVR
jgi:hypothetical protein